MALLPLRLFLGVTFVYAGVQKLSDPGFLHAGAPTHIGTQLRGFAHGTPGGFLLRTFAIPHAELAGVVVALVEIAVGLLVFAGLLTRLAAAVGLSLNLVFFLTASWHTSPYFLGSDIVFVFAWLPFVLQGARGQPAVDHVLTRWARDGSPWRQARRGSAAPSPSYTPRARPPPTPIPATGSRTSSFATRAGSSGRSARCARTPGARWGTSPGRSSAPATAACTTRARARSSPARRRRRSRSARCSRAAAGSTQYQVDSGPPLLV